MERLKDCSYGGGEACDRQGGSGAKNHSVVYVHPFPSIEELGGVLGAAPVEKSGDIYPAGIDIEVSVADDLAEGMLGVDLTDIFDTSAYIKKAIREFDVETEEGVDSLLALLPIMDPEILKDIMAEIWPGHNSDDAAFDPKLARLEIKGFLLDYLKTRG